MGTTFLFFQNLSIAVDKMTWTAQRAAANLKALGAALAPMRSLWLPTVGGEWPDRFTLLNRYVRTGHEPEYFTEERTVLT